MHFDSALTINGTTIPIEWRRHSKARRYILRFRRPPQVIATIPRGGSQREAMAFIQRNHAWIEKQLARPLPTPPTDIWFRGAKIPLDQFDPTFVRSLAEFELERRTRELALQTGSQIDRITIRSQRSRWGSCSMRRTISLNWRLIQTPPFVVDYIILHELMHLRQMNHSHRFWDEVEKVCPTWRDAEDWIRRHGREIIGS